MNKQAKIAELEKKIKEMQKVYKSDVKESYKEAQQTQEIIQQMNKQLQNLKEDSDSGFESQEFLLKSDGKEKTLIIGKTVDPSNGMISEDSPVGEQLLNSEPGDRIMIGQEEWTIT